MGAEQAEDEKQSMPPPSGPQQEERDGDPDKSQDMLLDEIQGCLEDLMSKSNLEEDAFIRQHMNAQMYVPLCILAAHHNLTKLGPSANIETLLTAARRSEKLNVDTDNLLIRPVMKHKRNTIILHDLPDGATEEDLRGLFKDCPEHDNLCALKPDVNHTAFVSFQTDESAQMAALWLRSQKLHGEAVQCAIKSEHTLRSFFPAGPGTPLISMASHSPPLHGGLPPWAQPGKGLGNISWPSSPWIGPQHWPSAGPGSGFDGSGEMWGNAWEHSHEDSKGGHDKGGAKGKSRGRRGKGEGQPAADVDMDAVNMEMMGAHLGENGGTAPELDESDLGYTHDFRKYSRQEIIEICSSMEEVTKPEVFAKLEKDDGCAALLRQNPCKDWAPLPTPMISFASSVFAGESRRGSAAGEDEFDDHNGDARSRRPSRPSRRSSSVKASSSGSWSKGLGRSGSGEYQEGSGGWDDRHWDWHGGDTSSWENSGGKGNGRWRASSRKRSSTGSSWGGDWYGPTWQPKDKEPSAGAARGRQASADPPLPSRAERSEGADGTTAAQRTSSAKPTWAEKLKEARGSEKGTTPQIWQAKPKVEAEVSAEAEAAVTSDKPEVHAAASPKKPDTVSGDGQTSNSGQQEKHEKHEETSKASGPPPSWADRVRQGK